MATTPAVAKEANPAAVHVCAVMHPREGQAGRLREALLALVAPTVAEAGNLAYEVYGKDDGALFVHEAWRSQDDLDRHLKTPDVASFVGRLGSLLEGANDAHFGKLISSVTAPATTAADRAQEGVVNICSFKHPRSGKASALRDALLALATPTSGEKGYLTYNLYEEADGAVFLFEQWRSQADLDRHFTQPHIRAFQRRVADLADRNEVHKGRLLSPPR